MNFYKRRLEFFVRQVLKEKRFPKMVFIGGPRQVGKTTLALRLLSPRATEQHPGYMNWDDEHTAQQIRKAQLAPDCPLIVFDEIHKYARWRNLLKGLFDTQKSTRRFVVTGSARLDYYRKGGDSLAGRYRYFRLHPLSLMELTKKPTPKDLERLLKYSGFPEPFVEARPSRYALWQRSHAVRVIREDLKDLSLVRETSLVEYLTDLLPSRVASLLSVQNLAEHIQVDHKTVVRYLQVLDTLCFSYRISAYKVKNRSIQKAQKLYLWNWSLVEDPGARFENLVASQLLKFCHWLEDIEGHNMELCFLRNTEGHEVDFVVLQNKKPLFGVECKLKETGPSKSLHYFRQRTPIQHWYQVHLGHESYVHKGVHVLPFIKFCQKLKMP